jgi:hypothetical protein
MYKDDSTDIIKSTAYKRQTPPIDDSTGDIQLQNVTQEPMSIEDDDESEHPQLNGWVCMGLLAVVTAVRLCALLYFGVRLSTRPRISVGGCHGRIPSRLDQRTYRLWHDHQGVCRDHSPPDCGQRCWFVSFSGIRSASHSYLFFAEHVSAVTVSVKDKLTLSMGVAVGSSIVSTRLFHILSC